MNFFKRLFKIGQAEVNASLDDMEDPIKMTEQGIRDLKLDLEKSTESLAQVKALSIRATNDIDELKTKANDYQEKAILALSKAKNGEITEEEADKLAKHALLQKETINKAIKSSELEAEKLENSVHKLKIGVQEIENTIHKWESELKTLKARHKVAKATKNLNKQMAEIDSSSTVAMLKRMKDKIQQEEALSEIYDDMNEASKTMEDKLEKLMDNTKASAEDGLLALKKQLGFKE